MTRPFISSRRQFVKAMGIGGATLALPGVLGGSRARAQLTTAPKRVLFWITPHGTVWNQWNMAVPGLTPGVTSAASIASLADDQFPRILAPLVSHKQKLTVVEGLARTSALAYERAHYREGGAYDLNRHSFGRAMMMTGVEPMQRAGSTCIGGGESIDQVIGRATTAPGRWGSRVYGYQQGEPYSFVARGESTPRVGDPRQAFDDIVGAYSPPVSTDTRESALRRARVSVLDFAAGEHARIAAQLGRDDREKLTRHMQLVRDLEASFAAPAAAPLASCSPSWSALGHAMDQFARVSTLAMACDMTRVVTFVTPNLAAPEIGLPAGTDIHQDYAHTSIRDSTGVFSLEGERGMIEFNTFYARRFAYLLDQLDSVAEGEGTLLDNTAVVWMSELATGCHELHDLPIVIAGGAGGALRTGRYVRYARDSTVDRGFGNSENIGPAQSQLYVSLMQAMGMTEDVFGPASTTKSDGTTLSLRGPLAELMA